MRTRKLRLQTVKGTKHCNFKILKWLKALSNSMRERRLFRHIVLLLWTEVLHIYKRCFIMSHYSVDIVGCLNVQCCCLGFVVILILVYDIVWVFDITDKVDNKTLKTWPWKTNNHNFKFFYALWKHNFNYWCVTGQVQCETQTKTWKHLPNITAEYCKTS